MKQLLTLSIVLLLIVSCGKYDQRGNVEDLTNRLNKVDTKLNELDSRLLSISRSVDQNTNAIFDNSYSITQLQTNLSEFNDRLEIEELESPVIVDIVKPCSDSKEVLIELDDGTIIGYFESGDMRFLSLLDSGDYVTTDGTGCLFTID